MESQDLAAAEVPPVCSSPTSRSYVCPDLSQRSEEVSGLLADHLRIDKIASETHVKPRQKLTMVCPQGLIGRARNSPRRAKPRVQR